MKINPHAEAPRTHASPPTSEVKATKVVVPPPPPVTTPAFTTVTPPKADPHAQSFVHPSMNLGNLPAPDVCMVNGVTIYSYGASPAAVIEAQNVARSVSHRSDLTNTMRSKMVTMVIIPAGVSMTSLPEFAILKGTKTFDGRPWDTVRGSGGLSKNGKVYVGVAEENLVQSSTNEYPKGYSIATHELAHTIQNYALPPDEAKAVRKAFTARTTAHGPWTEKYGSSNEQEYFAQLTDAWMGKNTGMGNNGAHWVQANDPVMAKILTKIYGPGAEPAATIANA